MAEAVRRALEAEPRSFDFVQAVRWLQRLAPEAVPVGAFGPPEREAVRFRVDATLGFPPTEVTALEAADGRPPVLGTACFGLIGATGPLPTVYTAYLAERRRARDEAPGAFFDIFQHRWISLLYRAATRHRLAIAAERGDRDEVAQHLLDVAGLGTPGLAERTGVDADALRFHAGLLAMGTRPAAALVAVIESVFGVAARLEEFVGAWYPLPGAAQCRLDEDDDRAGRLGASTVVGDEVWSGQLAARLHVGPLDRGRYEDFLPGGAAHATLGALIRLAVPEGIACEVVLRLRQPDIPPCALEPGGSARLGWLTWLGPRPPATDPADTMLAFT